MNITYARGTFAKAVDVLDAAGDDWTRGLTKAWLLVLEPVQSKDFPTELQQRFSELRHALTHVDAMQMHSEGNVKATIDQMDDKKGLRIKREIYAIYQELLEYKDS